MKRRVMTTIGVIVGFVVGWVFAALLGHVVPLAMGASPSEASTIGQVAAPCGAVAVAIWLGRRARRVSH